MCCLLTTLGLIGPRAAILVWWIWQPVRWEDAFSNFWVAFLGFLFAPWTTLSWVLVAPGGVSGFDVVIVGMGVIADLATYFGGGYGNRDRYARV